jgi:hypothetical protein
MAKRKRIPACEAKRLLVARGITFKKDFFALHLSEVEIVLDVAKAAGYRKRKDAPGSKARMFYYYLDRKRGC